jgi:CHAT domain
VSALETRTIRLEILRHGPAHNQLLSPLTPYLALCGNNDAEPVQVQFEHAALVRKLREVDRTDGKSPSPEGRAGIDDASAEVTRMLSSIRSLNAELAAARGEGARLVHLRLVLSAAELALLPFELVNAPAGMPGQGQRLSLQMVSPIVLTREVRRVSTTQVRWPERPRILVAGASPPGVPEVPLHQLLLAIRRALAPWLAAEEGQSIASAVGEHLTVLPNASLRDLHEECSAADPPYTHVHILAHGVPVATEADLGVRYGLALHGEDSSAPLDVVDGERLAAAIRCYRSGANSSLTTPAVVTLAICDSANVGSVITPGASIAHHLHEAGIPLVIASQFPLSFRGSTVLAETLYEGLLWGQDPRLIIHKIRQDLRLRCPDSHDWAALVVYAALPEDLDEQVLDAALERRRLAVDAAMARASTLGADGNEDGAKRSLEDAIRWLEETLPSGGPGDGRLRRSRVNGILGAARKRWAHILHERARRPAPPAITEALAREERRVLQQARDHYLAAYRLDPRAAWALVQHLALTAALGEGLEPKRWLIASALAEDDLLAEERQRVIWSRSALAELAVLAQLLPESDPARASAGLAAREHIEALLELTTPRSLDAYSSKRQLMRYAGWWWSHDAGRRDLPEALVALLDQRGVPSQWRQV